MSDRKSPWLADKRSKARMKELYDAEKQLKALRLAVMKMMNDKDFGPYYCPDLALSAGIEFKNGTWILKEGEK